MRAGPGVPVGGDTCLGGAVGGRGVKAGAASGKAFSCPPAPEPFLGKLLRLVKATGPRGERQQRPRGLWRARRPEVRVRDYGSAPQPRHLSAAGEDSLVFPPSLAAAAAKSLQSCPTLCDLIDGSQPGSSVPGILQARALEWVISCGSEVK